MEKVPGKGGEGAKYRTRQLFYQLPTQDFSPKYAKFMKEEAKPSFLALTEERSENVIGIGKVNSFVVLSFSLRYNLQLVFCS